MIERTAWTPQIGFVAMVATKAEAESEKQYVSEFIHKAAVEPRVTTLVGDHALCIFYDSSVSFATDEQQGIASLVLGEIYGEGGWRDAEWLTAAYIQKGLGCIDTVDGAFTVLFIDRMKGLIAFATDRFNARKAFYSRSNGCMWFSNSLLRHPVKDRRIDPAGLGYVLANGAIYNGHTLFDGVSSLDRASIHTVTSTGLDKRIYWNFEFTNGLSGSPESTLSSRLEELLVNGVKRSLGEAEEIYLSLSGGHDSRAILGILRNRLGIEDLHCFSYALGSPQPGSDPYVAVKTSAALGLQCEIIPSYAGDLPSVIRRNAILGQGITPFCDEMDAWATVSQRAPLGAQAILLVGEHCMGYLDCHLDSYEDVLTVTRIQDMDQLRSLNGRLPSDLLLSMKEAVEKDLLEMEERCPATADLHETKDFLFLDQRLCHVMLPWRERICGNFFRVRFPFLSKEILDFMKDLPSEWRRGKLLYKKTIRRMFPDIYRIPKATRAGYVPNWRVEFCKHKRAVADLVTNEPSRLDAVIPPDAILSLLEELTSWRSMIPFLKTLPGKAVLRTMKGSSTGNLLLLQFPVVDLKNVLKRILTIRRFLSQFP
jgi:asparagine synthase (glutamine-hydrolysing)